MTATKHAHKETPPVRISHIRIERLFGRKTYAIVQRGHGRLLALYGDNGCGKTTILDLIFHTLAPARRAGHRTHLLKVPFSNMNLTLTDGTEVRLTRPKNEITGSYTLTLDPATGRKLSVRYYADVSGRAETDHQQEPLFRKLESLNLELHHIPENRTITLSRGEFEQADEEPRPATEPSLELRTLADGSLKAHERMPAPLPVERALVRLRDWLRREALTLGNQATIQSHELLLRVLSTASELDDELASAGTKSLRKRLAETKANAERLGRFALVPELNIEDLLKAAHTLPKPRRETVHVVLRAYMDGIRARIDTYDSLGTLLARFTDHLEGFLQEMKCELTPVNGLTLRLDGKRLAPRLLSSGEKQLLLLLSSALIARSSRTIFLLDEPELSLNVKWQRRLLTALLDCSPGQFIVASHSIEMLAEHEDMVEHLSRQS